MSVLGAIAVTMGLCIVGVVVAIFVVEHRRNRAFAAYKVAESDRLRERWEDRRAGHAE